MTLTLSLKKLLTLFGSLLRNKEEHKLEKTPSTMYKDALEVEPQNMDGPLEGAFNITH